MSEAQVTGSASEELLSKFGEAPPEAWIAKNPGDTLTGAFLGLEQGTTVHGRSAFVVIGTDQGPKSVWLFYESLKSGFRRTRPQVGEIVAIRYNGEVKSKNPTPGRSETYHDYQVVVDRPQGSAVDWDNAGIDAA